MIILVGKSHDPILAKLGAVLARQKLAYLVINQDWLGVKIFVDAQNIYWENKKVINTHSITGVFNRYIFENNLAHPIEHQRLYYVMDQVWPCVVNPFVYGVSHYAKLYQLSLLPLRYIKRPESEIRFGTLVSQINAGEYIFKSVSGLRSIVKTVAQHRAEYCPEPVLFRNIIGDLIYTYMWWLIRLWSNDTSNAVDYRYAPIAQHTSWKLPNTSTQNCRAIAKFCSLLYVASILFFAQSVLYIRSKPMPGFDYFCQALSQTNIYNVLVKYLTGEKMIILLAPHGWLGSWLIYWLK